PINGFERFFLGDRKFVGGDSPSIADIRWAASFEFLRSIDYPFSPRIEQFLSDMEEALGEAYSEPAADVRGYVESVKSPAERPSASSRGGRARAAAPSCFVARCPTSS